MEVEVKNSIGQNSLGMKYMPLSIDMKSLFSSSVEVDIPWILLDCGINLDWILSVQAGRTKLLRTSNKTLFHQGLWVSSGQRSGKPYEMLEGTFATDKHLIQGE